MQGTSISMLAQILLITVIRVGMGRTTVVCTDPSQLQGFITDLHTPPGLEMGVCEEIQLIARAD